MGSLSCGQTFLEEYLQNELYWTDSGRPTVSTAAGLKNVRLDRHDGYRISANSAYRSTPLSNVAVSKSMRFTTRDKDQDIWGSNCTRHNVGLNGDFGTELLPDKHVAWEGKHLRMDR